MSGGTMKVVINGKEKELTGPLTLAHLIEKLDLPVQAVAVQHNGDVVPRDTFAACTIQDGDRLEIVRPIGGGSPRAAAGRRCSDGRHAH